MPLPPFTERIPGLSDVSVWATAYLAPARLDILLHLSANGEQAVSAIAESLELERSSISHALTKLRDDGLVHVRAEARRRFYRTTNRFMVESSETEFTITITRDDGYSLVLRRAMDKIEATPPTNPQPANPPLKARAIEPKTPTNAGVITVRPFMP